MKQQKLPERDRNILIDLYNFNGLPMQSILDKYFGDKTDYGYKRLAVLQERGLINKTYYYVSNRGAVRRVAAILYITYQGLKFLGIDKTVSTANVKPREEGLDVHYMLGSLYTSIPELLAGRTAREKYNLKNYMPITCCYPGTRPVYIFIIGQTPARNEVARFRGFVKSSVYPGDHLVISRRFYKPLGDIPIRFVPWDLAREVVPIGLKNKDHYLEEFRGILRSRFSNIVFGSKHGDFQEVKINNRMYNIGEIFFGNSEGVRQALSNPLNSTLLYTPSRVHFPGIKLEKGSFLFFSRKDEAFYKMEPNEKSRMVSRPYQF